MKKILMNHCLVPWESLKEAGDIEYWEVSDVRKGITKDEWLEKISATNPDCIAGWLQVSDLPDQRFTAEMMDAAERLEFLFTFTIGYDHIDVGAATERGIMVSNCGGVPYSSESVAELAWAHILAVARRIPQNDAGMRTGELMKPGRFLVASGEDLMFYRGGPVLWGKTLGIIGLGPVGSRTAMIGKFGFNMKVIAYDPYVPPIRAQLIGVELVDLDTLLKESDVISIHALLTDETQGMIGKREIGIMKPTAILVNDARGEIIDMPALAKALEEGRILGAGIDTWPEEPPNPDDWWVKSLQKSRRTSLTCHVGTVYEGIIQRHKLAIENIRRFCGGESPWWVVNPEVFYSGARF